jgi:hypothetical protein
VLALLQFLQPAALHAQPSQPVQAPLVLLPLQAVGLLVLWWHLLLPSLLLHHHVQREQHLAVLLQP